MSVYKAKTMISTSVSCCCAMSLDRCAISGLKTIRARPYLSDLLVWAFPIGCELVIFTYACYDFYATKNEVSDLDWLQLHCPVMETWDAELVKCFLETGISSDRGEKL